MQTRMFVGRTKGRLRQGLWTENAIRKSRSQPEGTRATPFKAMSEVLSVDQAGAECQAVKTPPL